MLRDFFFIPVLGWASENLDCYVIHKLVEKLLVLGVDLLRDKLGEAALQPQPFLVFPMHIVPEFRCWLVDL